jgi:hypothetical protein
MKRYLLAAKGIEDVALAMVEEVEAPEGERDPEDLRPGPEVREMDYLRNQADGTEAARRPVPCRKNNLLSRKTLFPY